jgi:hypothetical protein
MKMQLLFLLLAISILLFSCKPKGNNKQSSANSEKQLPGEWMISSFNNGAGEIVCNMCPRLEFKSDHSATVVLPSGDKTAILWTVIGDTLKLNYALDKSNPDPFGRKAYLMKFKSMDKYTSLTLVQTDNAKRSYSLSSKQMVNSKEINNRDSVLY